MWVVSGCLLRSLHPFEIYLKIENKEIYGGCGSLYGIERKYEKEPLGELKKVGLAVGFDFGSL
jgi:hypothetical protein